MVEIAARQKALQNASAASVLTTDDLTLVFPRRTAIVGPNGGRKNTH